MTELFYIRVPLSRLVSLFHESFMRGTLVDYSYDATKDHVLIETMGEEIHTKEETVE